LSAGSSPTGEPSGDLLQGPPVAVRVLELGVGVVAGSFRISPRLAGRGQNEWGEGRCSRRRGAPSDVSCRRCENGPRGAQGSAQALATGVTLEGSTRVTTSYASAETRRLPAANGIDYAYREVGVTGAGAGAPLLLLQHFRGNLDNWDPALVDALAGSR